MIKLDYRSYGPAYFGGSILVSADCDIPT